MISATSLVDEMPPASARLLTLFDVMGLHNGERAALAVAEHMKAWLLLCDDAAARLAAESAGIVVRGTVGVLVRSIRRGLRSRDDVLQTMKQLPQKSSLHISQPLLLRAIEMVERSQQP